MNQSLKNFWAWLRQPHNLIATLLCLLPIYGVYLYMSTYGRNVPINDQWLFSYDIALAAQDGSLSLDLILRDFAGHRIFFTGSLTALLSYFTNWNASYEMWVNLPLAIAEFIVLVAIFKRAYPQLTAYVMFPFALITFSLYQYLNWLCGFYSIWHFVPLFFLLMLYSLQRLPIGWAGVILAAFFSFCATFSLAPGVVTWPAALIALFLFGYRKPAHYALFIAALALTIFIYTREVQVSMAEGEGERGGFTSISLDDPIGVVGFTLAYLGGGFTTVYDATTAQRIAVLGLIACAANVAYLWRQERHIKNLAVWLTMIAYAGGVAFLTALTRYEPDNISKPLEQRYITTSNQLWLALIAMMGISAWYAYRKAARPRWENGLMFANMGLALLLLILYTQSNIWNLQATARRYDNNLIREKVFYTEEDCIRDFPLYRQNCYQDNGLSNQIGHATPEQIYQLAAYELTAFAGQDKAYILPEGQYEIGSPIIIDSPSPWLNVYIRDWMLNNVAHEVMFHIAPPPEVYSLERLDQPISPQPFDLDTLEPNLLDFIGESQQVWYLHTSETSAHAPQMENLLRASGYTPLFMPIQHPRYTYADFMLIRYLKAPENAANQFNFDETIHLQNWSVSPNTQLIPCEPITVETWWLVDEAPSFNYSASVFLADASGIKQIYQDGGLADIEMGVWQPDLLYQDRRNLDIPCDLPTGRYTLGVELYNYETLESLLVTNPQGHEMGLRAPLLEMILEEEN